jgi:hypothetical protein
MKHAGSGKNNLRLGLVEAENIIELRGAGKVWPI